MTMHARAVPLLSFYARYPDMTRDVVYITCVPMRCYSTTWDASVPLLLGFVSQ